jgi:hypothetical protein
VAVLGRYCEDLSHSFLIQRLVRGESNYGKEEEDSRCVVVGDDFVGKRLVRCKDDDVSDS